MAKSIYGAVILIGGAAGALDAIAGTNLVEGDPAIVMTDGNTYFYRLDATSGAAESSPDVISPDTDAGTKRWILQTVISESPYIRLHDSKASGTDGGSASAATWHKRDITEDVDTHDLCSVASSVITLQAGTYTFRILSTVYDVNRNKPRLRNTSDSTTPGNGLSAYCHSSYNQADVGVIIGRFTIASAKNFEVQFYCEQAKVNTGLGLSLSTGEEEVYTVAEFWKE